VETTLSVPPPSSTEASVVSSIIESVYIPPRPALLLALQREIGHLDPQLKRIAQLISRDVAMAGKLLQAANSAYFALPRQIDTVDDALSMIGMNQCAALMTSLITRTLMGNGRMMMARFWDVSEKRAKGMALLTRRNHAAAPELGHTFGLFCDIGIPLMKAHFPTYLETLSVANQAAGTAFTAIELARHGTDHAVVGATLAEQWGIDADIVSAIRLHHAYESLYDESVPATVRGLLASNLVVEKAIQEFRGDAASLEWQAGGAIATAALGMTADEVEAACLELKRTF
jgi:HD-like signal output (HDOD) protein